MSGFDLACLDMAGTTVQDNGLVERAFTTALVRRGTQPWHPEFERALSYIRETMGQSKIEVFRHLTNGDADAADQLNVAFEAAYADLVRDGAVAPLPGARTTLRRLREAKVRTALTTGFSKATQDAIVDALAWRDQVDAVICPGGTIRGRPHPDMILAAAERCAVSDLARVAVVGDTPSDVESGLRAGAGLVVGVLTGTGTREELLAAGAHQVVDSVRELPDLL